MLKSKIYIKDIKTFKILNHSINYETFKDYRLIDNNFINLNSQSVLYDLDIKRISIFIYNKDIQRVTTIKKTLDLKLYELINLKKTLNIKKKSYIDILRAKYESITKENTLNLFNDEIKFYRYKDILKQLHNLKIIQKDNNIGYYIVLNFWLQTKDTNILNNLISINKDIESINEKIKTFNSYYNEITQYKFKINSYDLKLLDKNIISQNVRENIYFYLIKLKKTKSFKINDILRFKLNSCNLNLNNELNKIRENLFNNEFKNIIKDISTINETLQNTILNKYI